MFIPRQTTSAGELNEVRGRCILNHPWVDRAPSALASNRSRGGAPDQRLQPKSEMQNHLVPKRCIVQGRQANSKYVLKIFASYSCVFFDQYSDTGRLLLGGNRNSSATTVIIIKMTSTKSKLPKPLANSRFSWGNGPKSFTQVFVRFVIS